MEACVCKESLTARGAIHLPHREVGASDTKHEHLSGVSRETEHRDVPEKKNQEWLGARQDALPPREMAYPVGCAKTFYTLIPPHR